MISRFCFILYRTANSYYKGSFPTIVTASSSAYFFFSFTAHNECTITQTCSLPWELNFGKIKDPLKIKPCLSNDTGFSYVVYMW